MSGRSSPVAPLAERVSHACILTSTCRARILTHCTRHFRRPLLAQPERQGREEVSGNQSRIPPSTPPDQPTHNATTSTSRNSSTSRSLPNTMSNPPHTINSGLTGYLESRAGATRQMKPWKQSKPEGERAREVKREYTHERTEERSRIKNREGLDFLLDQDISVVWWVACRLFCYICMPVCHFVFCHFFLTLGYLFHFFYFPFYDRHNTP